jgi:hypothetical protein
MRKVVKVADVVIGFAALAVLLALRIAVAAVLAVVTPVVMPILVLLSGGGLLVATAFAYAGHWRDAAKGLGACLICSITFVMLAALIQWVNPQAFVVPVAAKGDLR